MLPNFLIIGAPRSGTTTLYTTLQLHPQIFLSPVKEPMFFLPEIGDEKYTGSMSPNAVRCIEAYQSLFRQVKGQKAIGEATPCYLYSKSAPVHIKECLPKVKCIAILRNPVDRAYSHFQLNRLAGIEPIADFEEAMAAEERRIRNGWFIFWSYLGMGFYGRQIRRYFSLFDKRQFLFFLLEDLISDPTVLFRDIFRFLEVDDTFQIQHMEKYNPSGTLRSRFIHDLMAKPHSIKKPLKKILPERIQRQFAAKIINFNLRKTPLSPEIRRKTAVVFRKDIQETQSLLGRDLSSWIE